MSHIVFSLMLLGQAAASPGDSMKVVAVIRDAYEANRAALSGFGTIRFHQSHGLPGWTVRMNAVRGLLRSDWKRLSSSRGTFVFDGQSRRYENLYPTEQLVANRVKLSSTLSSSIIFATRLLSDGDTTLKDNVDVDIKDDKTILHTPACYLGTEVFFRYGGNIPLQLTNPELSEYDLGGCLRDLMEGREGTTLAEITESAKLDDIAVTKLRIELANPHRQVTFWVDLEHGAIPLRTQVSEDVTKTDGSATDQIDLDQIDYDDIRWVGKGWLPFRRFVVQGHLSAVGELTNPMVREVVIDEADFEKKPDPAAFALEFPGEFHVIDVHRRLTYGKRRVWTLGDFSPAGRAQARPIHLEPALTGPAMAAEREAWKWWPALYLLLGFACLTLAATAWFRKARPHAA